MPTPRDYQLRCRDSILQEFKEVQSTLVTKPTGTGKTVTISLVIKAMQPVRALVVAHREELIWQARRTIEEWTGLDCEIEMGDLSASTSLFHRTPVVIATIQTLSSSNRLQRFRPDDFGLVVCDEGHHGTADTYRRMFNHFSQNSNLKILGVTATPDRADEEALGQIFQTVAFDYEILDAIRDGWLVPIEQQFVSVAGLDFSTVKTTAGDLNGADLAAVMEAESNLHGVATPTIEIIGSRRAIVFASSVAQAETLSNIFNRHKTGLSEWVCGKTPKDDRREILQRFKDGSTQVVVNVGVLTEGFDDPGVEVIVMARPTKSRALYAQMAGRSTRPLPGVVDNLPDADTRRACIAASAKPSCLLVDFVGNSGKHKLMSSADILGGNCSDEAVAKAVERAKRKGGPVMMTEELQAAEAELIAETEKRRKLEEARKARLVARAKYTSKLVNPFDALDIQPVRERGWDTGKTLSEKQRALLQKQGVDPDSMPYAQGRQIINELFRRWNGGLCSMKQSAVLKRYGYETKNMTREQASKALDALSRNNWKRLEPVNV